MKLNEYKLVFVSLALIGSLLIASPALGLVIHLPGISPFSEIYVLGETQNFSNYPYNVTATEAFSVTIGVNNHESSLESYLLNIKIVNSIDALPDAVSMLPSSSTSLYETNFFLKDGQEIQQNMTFVFSNVVFSNNQSRVNTVEINGYAFNVDLASELDESTDGYRYWIVFELWLHNRESGLPEYHNYFVELQLNLQPT
jgi:uncharacterized membrane protein